MLDADLQVPQRAFGPGESISASTCAIDDRSLVMITPLARPRNSAQSCPICGASSRSSAATIDRSSVASAASISMRPCDRRFPR